MPGLPRPVPRVLLTGWFSFRHGEATAGDVMALETVTTALTGAGVACDTVWSPVFRPGGLSLEQADPGRYSHLVFVCGPVHGAQVAGLHQRFAACVRIAVGVSVVDPADPAAAGFDMILARDGAATPPVRDLSVLAASVAAPPLPVTGVALTTGQGEYGSRRRHEAVTAALTGWLATKACAPVPLETRLDTRDWRLCSTSQAFLSLLARLDLLVTTRLHGLALGLRAGVPVLAADPVHGGGKVTAQAAAWRWPALLPAGQVSRDQLDQQWDWCLSPAGQAAARAAARQAADGPQWLLAALARELRPPAGPRAG